MATETDEDYARNVAAGAPTQPTPTEAEFLALARAAWDEWDRTHTREPGYVYLEDALLPGVRLGPCKACGRECITNTGYCCTGAMMLPTDTEIARWTDTPADPFDGLTGFDAVGADPSSGNPG